MKIDYVIFHETIETFKKEHGRYGDEITEMLGELQKIQSMFVAESLLPRDDEKIREIESSILDKILHCSDLFQGILKNQQSSKLVYYETQMIIQKNMQILSEY